MRNKDELINQLNLNPAQADIVVDDNHETIVPAGAGSGKTKTLVAKIIELLFSGKKIESFLVLTFTNKAAAEMKDRVKKELRSNEKLSHLANQVDSSHIQTFDSFAYNFVKQNATYLNKDSNLELLDGAIFASVKYELMNDLVIQLIKERKYEEDEIKYLSNLTRKNSESDLVSALVNVYNQLDSSYDINLIDDNFIDQKQLNIDCFEIKEAIKEINYDFYNKFEDKLTDIFGFTNQLLDLNNPTDPLLVSYPTFRWTDVTEAEKKEILNLLSPIKTLIKEKITKDDLNKYSQLMMTYQKITLEIIKQFHQQLSNFKLKANKYEFNDIANFLIQLLTNNPDVLARLKEKFEYIFIDEFQDTSKIQSDFLQLLINENDSAKVLYVGDIKQSIYKFRNAVPQNFIDKQKSANQIPLSINYRSAAPIIDFVNSVFTSLLTSEEKHDIKYHPDHLMIAGSTYYKDDSKAGVYLEIIAPKDIDKPKADPIEEAFVVGNKIKQLLKDNTIKKYSECAILLRNSTHFKTYKEVFDYLNIPLQVQVPTKLKDTYFLKLLANLLMLASYYNDETKFDLNRFNYLSVARSELFNYDDYKLFNELIDRNHKILLIDEKILELLKKLQHTIKFQTNYQIIDDMISLFEIDKKILASYYVKEKGYVIDYLYNLTATLSDLNIIGYDFVKFVYEVAYDKNNLEISILQEKEENSVKMTTIHKSKGLEYKVLFLGGLNNSIFPKRSEGVISFEKDFGFGFTDKLNFISNQNIKTVSSIFNSNKKILKQNNLVKEELRLHYVAITRAERMLFLVMLPDCDAVKPQSFAEYLYFAKIDKIIKEKNITRYQEQLKEGEYFDALSEKRLYYPPQIDDLCEVNFSFKDEVKDYKRASITVSGLIDPSVTQLFELGTRLHQKIEYADFKNLDTSDDLHLRQLGLTEFGNKQLKVALEIYHEFDFVDLANDLRGSIDMLVIYDDEIHIIDFKTKNIDLDKYANQLLSYRRYIVGIYPNLPIKCFLYSILDGDVSELK